jgi:hypothetical protein
MKTLTKLIIVFVILISFKIVQISMQEPWQWKVQPSSIFDVLDTTKTIPRRIWTFWNKSELPCVVKKCIDTWYVHCPDYVITVIRPETLHEFIKDIDLLALPFADNPQRLSDFVRLHVLHEYGGFWVDASIVMFENLDYFHEKQQSSPSVEVVGYRTSKHETRPEFPMIENWFFGCVQQSVFIGHWKSEFMRINDFSNSILYVENMKMNGINLQNIGYLRYYLSMHVAAQSVIQRKQSITKLLYLDRSEDGPFEYWLKYSWGDKQKAIDRLCHGPFIVHSPFIKFTTNGRKCLNKNVKNIDLIIKNGSTNINKNINR